MVLIMDIAIAILTLIAKTIILGALLCVCAVFSLVCGVAYYCSRDEAKREADKDGMG